MMTPWMEDANLWVHNSSSSREISSPRFIPSLSRCSLELLSQNRSKQIAEAPNHSKIMQIPATS
jgi:hypothetical protein